MLILVVNLMGPGHLGDKLWACLGLIFYIRFVGVGTSAYAWLLQCPVSRQESERDTRMDCPLLPDCGFSVTKCFKLPLWFLHRDAEPLNCETKIPPPPAPLAFTTCLYQSSRTSHYWSATGECSLLGIHHTPWKILKKRPEQRRNILPSVLSFRRAEHLARWQRRNTRSSRSYVIVTRSWAMVRGESVSMPLILREARSVWK